MHYPQLVSTTCVSAGIIAMDAVVQLVRWQCADPAMLSRTGKIALRAHHARVAGFGVRQPCCHASRTHDPARVTPFSILVTGMLNVLVSIIESVRNECDTCA